MKPARSLRVVLAAIGTRGDVQPMLALAQALAGRGHRPLVAASPDFEGWVRGLGFDFAPLGRDMRAWLDAHAGSMTGNPVKMAREATGFLREQMPVTARDLVSACEGADALAWGGLAMASPTVAERLRLPVLCVLYTSCMLPSDRHPPPNIPWHGMPAAMNRFFWGVNRLLVDSLIRGPLNATRAGLGLPPVASVRRHVLTDSPLVIAADEDVSPPDPGWEGRFPYANYLFFDDPAPLDPDLEAWLAEGEPPVFVGFGSMSGAGTHRIERMIVEAVAGTGRRCIVGAGWAGLGASALPAGWRVVREAPHGLLFPRTAAVVHHGGSGTTAQALRAGVPQVLLPLLLDQFHHAHRLHVAGIAPRPVPMEKVTAAQLAEAIRLALALPPGPREAAAARLRASDARGDIVRRIEAMAAA